MSAALPVINSLRDLLQTGDQVKKITGCTSGTLAYVLRSFTADGSVTFSQAVKQAVDWGYTEPDVRDDLTGIDMAAKTVALARECGVSMSVEDVEIEGLLPKEIAEKTYPEGTKYPEITEDVLATMGTSLDEPMAKMLAEAQKDDKVLRYAFELDLEKGTAKVGPKAVDNTNPLFRLKADENLVCFTTDRYKSSPLVVKGSAAGAELAAAGIFADILRLARVFNSQL